MSHSRTLSRMLTAAEEWGHTTYGQKMSALLTPSTGRHDDGALFMTVKLYRAGPAPKTARRVEPVVCAVTLEPDGNLRCIETGDLQLTR